MISQDRAQALFDPIKKDLTAMIVDSWANIHKSNLHFKSRSRASLMWDETLFRANIAWCESDQIQKIEEKKSQTAHYWFDNRTFFRIKKGDKRGYTRNYPTLTAMEFHEPESDLFGGVDKLEVTYVLDHHETTIVDIAVVYRNCGEVDFRFSILDNANVEPVVSAKTNEDGKDAPRKEITKLKRELHDEEIESEDDQ